MKLSKQISIQSNLFFHNNILFEKLYNFKHEYRFFIDNDTDYDYVKCNELISKLNNITN